MTTRLPTGHSQTDAGVTGFVPDPDTWEWLRHAACADADPELFFPVGESGPAAAQAKRAKEVCHSCPVEAECLEWALNIGRNNGVWGGTDENERRRLRRRADRRPAARRPVLRGPAGRGRV